MSLPQTAGQVAALYSSLLELPAELRNRVYAMAVIEDRPIRAGHFYVDECVQRPPPLLHICR